MGILGDVVKDYEFLYLRDLALRGVKYPKIVAYLSYNGFQAIIGYRILNKLWNNGWRSLSLILSNYVRKFTGVEIHPGATIESPFGIDHGSGVVIGETVKILKGCLLYHGVTLGGTLNDRVLRHPMLSENVTVGAMAQIIGPIKIGNQVRIGANATVTKNVLDHCTIVGVNKVIKGEENEKD